MCTDKDKDSEQNGREGGGRDNKREGSVSVRRISRISILFIVGSGEFHQN